MILADPDAWSSAGDALKARMGAETYDEWHATVHDPATVTAMLEDYRAGLGIDRAHDNADQAAARRVTCPLLVLWSRHDDLEDFYGDPPVIWRDRSTSLRGGHSIDSGHHMAEEAPDELAGALARFLDSA